MQVGVVKIGDFRQRTRYNSKTSTFASVVNLIRSQVSYTALHVCLQHLVIVMQRVARVRQRQLMLVIITAVRHLGLIVICVYETDHKE